MKSKYILLNKSILNKIEADKQLLFAIINKYKTVRDEIIFTLDYIFKNLNISNNNSYAKKKIIDTLLLWQKMGIYKFNIDLNKIKNSDLIIADQCYDSSDNFVMIYDDELDKILRCKENIDINKLFAVFVYIKSCMDNQTSICYPSFEKIKQNTLINHNKTISQYVNILQNLGLIIIDNPGHKVFKDGTIKRSNNFYALPGHKEDLHMAIEKEKQRLEERKIKIAKGKNANKKRSIAMKKYWREKIKNKPPIPQVSADPPSPQDSEYGEIPKGIEEEWQEIPEFEQDESKDEYDGLVEFYLDCCEAKESYNKVKSVFRKYPAKWVNETLDAFEQEQRKIKNISYFETALKILHDLPIEATLSN